MQTRPLHTCRHTHALRDARSLFSLCFQWMDVSFQCVQRLEMILHVTLGRNTHCLLGFLLPSLGRLQVELLSGQRGGPRDPLSEWNCFNQGPMPTPTKEPGRNHRLLLCCGGSQRGWERAAGPVAAPQASALFALEIVLSQVTVKAARSRDDVLHCNQCKQSACDCHWRRTRPSYHGAQLVETQSGSLKERWHSIKQNYVFTDRSHWLISYPSTPAVRFIDITEGLSNICF